VRLHRNPPRGELASSRNLRELTVHASVTARPFFERHGFAVVEERHPAIGAVAMVNFLMVRRLS
jgi:putative acetyltransferase